MKQIEVKGFYEVINMLDTVLYSIKWIKYNNPECFGLEYVTFTYEFCINKLKVLCINNIGDGSE